MKNQSKQKKPEYRLYAFTNRAITSLQKGLQTAHVVSELFTTSTKEKEWKILNRWAEYHKTIIILDGGNHHNLKTLASKLASLAGELHLPHASFCEDEETLNNAMTAVGIVVPDSIYTMNLLTADDGDYPEKELKELLSDHRLAI